jgi:hypothetical protein
MTYHLLLFCAIAVGEVPVAYSGLAGPPKREIKAANVKNPSITEGQRNIATRKSGLTLLPHSKEQRCRYEKRKSSAVVTFSRLELTILISG